MYVCVCVHVSVSTCLLHQDVCKCVYMYLYVCVLYVCVLYVCVLYVLVPYVCYISPGNKAQNIG